MVPWILEQLATRHDLTPELRADLEKLLTSAQLGMTSVEPPKDWPEISNPTIVMELTNPGEPAAISPYGERYEDRGALGIGGMAEVRLVYDRELAREVALKIIRRDLSSHGQHRKRFISEAQTGAQLEHPGLVPVYDQGQLPDGRVWFTMKVVRGRTLFTLLRDVHARGRDPWEPTAGGWSLRRLIDLFQKVCSAVGYAHERGVVHRDLKPDNIMVGEHDEVLVLDWGLARPDDPHRSTGDALHTARGDKRLTQPGAVAGTPAYMAPEQRTGDLGAIGPATDVYGLGCVLWEILTGAPPIGASHVHDEVTEALPPDLVETVTKATSAPVSSRHPNAGALAEDVRAWLDGARQRERALELVDQAQALAPQARRDQAQDLRTQAAAQLADVPVWASVAHKAAAWALEDQAAELERSARREGLQAERLLHGALTHAAELPEAQAGLAQRCLAAHKLAEVARDEETAERWELQLREHARALPLRHPMRRDALSYLRGTGTLSLRSDPPGANAELYRYEPSQRRLLPLRSGRIGPLPIAGMPLEMGSYLVLLSAPGHALVHYPVHIGRQVDWDCVPPGASEPEPVHLPPAGAVGLGECYVPASWAWTGDDYALTRALPRRRLWVPGFVMQHTHVTVATWLDYCNALLETEGEQAALRRVPRERPAVEHGESEAQFGRDPQGRFVLVADADGDLWDPEWPVPNVDWPSARAYADWYARRTGRPWRLPTELEWEKAARGVDGRFFPWGDFLDPSWTFMHDSHQGRRLPSHAGSHPKDVSPYGVLDLAGNFREWCDDPYVREHDPAHGDRLEPAASTLAPDDPRQRTVRGGGWDSPKLYCRTTTRTGLNPSFRYGDLGFRLVRSLG